MDKQEVTRLLSIISAYYGTTKTDPSIMVNAWHLLLKDYDYNIAEQAVLEYAKNDTREYSQFPKVGVIIKSIEEEKKAITAIRNCALYEKRYDEIPERSKKWITEERFERLKKCPEEYLLGNMEQIRSTLSRDLITERKNENDQTEIRKDTERIESTEEPV